MSDARNERNINYKEGENLFYIGQMAAGLPLDIEDSNDAALFAYRAAIHFEETYGYGDHWVDGERREENNFENWREGEKYNGHDMACSYFEAIDAYAALALSTAFGFSDTSQTGEQMLETLTEQLEHMPIRDIEDWARIEIADIRGVEVENIG